LRISIPLFIVFSILLTSCQNDPDPTGIGLIPEGDLIGAQRFDSVRDSGTVRTGTIFHPIAPASSAILSIGESGGYRARSVIRWYTIADTIGWRGRIVSATVRLHALPYHIGDASSALTLQVREVKSFWSSFTLTSESMDTLDISQEVSGSLTAVLRDNDSVDIALDTNLVRSWLVKMDTGAFTENYGILIEATGGVRTFQSAETTRPPELTIVLETASGLDTLRGGTIEDTYTAIGPNPSHEAGITVHGGLAFRGKLYFDVALIPPASIVNHASLYLTMDRSRSTTHYLGRDSVLLYQNFDSTKTELQGTPILTRVDNGNADLLIAEGVPLTRAVQTWVNGKGNQGLLLSHIGESSELDRLTFFGVEADSTLRPRLVITYTQKP
jgi:hypothetical protein